MGVKVDRSSAKISHLQSVKGTFVAGDIDGGIRRANIVNQGRVGEEINRELTIQKDKVITDGSTVRAFLSKEAGFLGYLSKDEDTLIVTGLRCIVAVSHHMNL